MPIRTMLNRRIMLENGYPGLDFAEHGKRDGHVEGIACLEFGQVIREDT